MSEKENFEDVEGEGLIKLLIPQRRVQEPNLAVQWCISRELVRLLEERRVHQPFVFICVTDAEGDEVPGMRQLVPLDQMQARIAFHRPGLHAIHARVVWPKEGGKIALFRQRYLRRESGMRKASYENYMFIVEDAMLEKSDTDLIEAKRRRMIDKATATPGLGLSKKEVVIDDGLFAKPPPAWLAWWLMFPDGGTLRLEDECHLRRRVLGAIFVKPLFILAIATLIILIRGLGAVGWILFFAGRGVNWEPVFHPFRGLMEDKQVLPRRYQRLQRIAFGLAFRGREQKCSIWSLHALFLMPIVWAVMAIPGAWVCVENEIALTFWNVAASGALTLIVVYGAAAVFLVVFSVVIATGTFVIGLLRSSFQGIDRWVMRWLDERSRREQQRAERQVLAGEFEIRFQDIVCDDARMTFKPFQAIPKRPTVIFSELKAAVCKPYAE